MSEKKSVEKAVREIRHKSRKKYTAEEKIRIVLEGLRGESTIAELCRRGGINTNMYYKWSKEFLDAGKERLLGNTKRQADSRAVQGLKQENEQLKAMVAEISLKNRVLKKSLLGKETLWDDECGARRKRSARSSISGNILRCW